MYRFFVLGATLLLLGCTDPPAKISVQCARGAEALADDTTADDGDILINCNSGDGEVTGTQGQAESPFEKTGECFWDQELCPRTFPADEVVAFCGVVYACPVADPSFENGVVCMWFLEPGCFEKHPH